MAVEHWDPERDGPFSEAALRQKIETRGYRVERYVYPPGTVFPPHTHPVDKIDAVVSGRFKLTMQGQTYILGPGDLIHVPRGTVHDAAVVGDEPVVSLDGVRIPTSEA